MTDPEVRNPYEPMREVGDGLWCVDGWWKRSPMGRRMTVMRVGDELAIHGAIRMGEADMQRLDELGRVAWVIASNPFHASEAPWYAERYPEAMALVPRAMRVKQEQRMRVDGTVEEDWPAELAGQLEARTLKGLRFPESIFFHARSRTLVVTDLVMNFPDDRFRGFLRIVMRLNGILGRFASSRLFRSAIKDRARLRESIETILAWDFDRVVMSHGGIVEGDGKSRLRAALSYLE